MTPRLAWVQWVDSGGSSGWEPRDEAVKGAAEDPMLCESVGWLLVENDEYVLIAGTRKEWAEVHCSLQIPRCAVVEIRPLSQVRV